MIDLTHRTAIVTGASRGIGRAIALELAGYGAAVIVNYHASENAAREVVSTIRARGGSAEAVYADVSRPEEVNALIQAALETYTHLDILVNNAGINRDTLLLRMSEEDWDRVLDLNLKGSFLTTKAALRPMLRQRWGRIINIASIAGLAGNAGQANYASAKAGLIGLTKATAREVASRGTTVNAIAPGFIETDMTAKLNDVQKEAALKQIPLERFGAPQDVAHLAAFLASDDASYITGQVINVDGGMVML